MVRMHYPQARVVLYESPKRPTIVETIEKVLESVVGILRFNKEEYWMYDQEHDTEDDSDEDSDRHQIRKSEGEHVRTLRRIFLSPLTMKRILILSCVAVSIDPLFFYIPVINDEKKCLGIDKILGAAALCLRALPDAAFVLHTISSGFRLYPKVGSGYFLKILFFSFVSILVAVFLMLPIPQLAIAVSFFKSGGYVHFGQRVTVNILLFVYYVARVVLIYLFSQKVKYNTGIWVRASFNFFFYMVASNVLGGFWYFFSIQREISCWQSCRNALGCGATYCRDSTSGDITFRDELCPINPQNTTIFNFGIFFEAIQSGITRSLHLPTKFFYGIWWGIRNLSNFGTNLQTSSYVWEICFALVISITGLLLFLYLIGNVQIYMQHAKTKSLEAEAKAKELKAKRRVQRTMIQSWMSVNYIPGGIARNIKQYIKNDKLVENNINAEVDVHYMFSILSKYGRKLLQRHFCMDVLKQVNHLRNMEEEMVEMICDYMTLEMFDENKYVVEAGNPHKLVMIIVEGSVRVMCQPTRDGAAEAASPQTLEERVISEGELVDEALVDWAATTRSFNDPPTSSVNVQCITKVAAFVLRIEDLKRLVIYKRIIFHTN